MISWMSSWAQGIIVAVIIATIIELILPNGSSKKYVKVVIGIYVLFTIISPVIEKFSNKNTDINEIFNTKEYEEIIAKSDNNISKKIESNNSKTIKDIYTSNLEADIKAKLKEKGYDVYVTYIKIKDDENYTIEKISLSIVKQNEEANEQRSTQNSITIEKVNIQIENNTISDNNLNNSISDNKSETNTGKNNVGLSEKNEIKEYLSKTYDIDLNNIEIS